jgi:hypothetical protein
MERLLSEIVTAFGGTEGLVSKLHEDYEAAAPGSPVRQRLMVFITDLLRRQEEERQEREEDFSQISDENLEAILVEYTRKVCPEAGKEGWTGLLLTLEMGERDHAAIQEAVAAWRRRGGEAGTDGAAVAGVCREWLKTAGG